MKKKDNNAKVLLNFLMHEYCPLISETIRDYFGEQIGIYFSFLGFYTKALILPAAVGLIYFLLETFVGHLPHGYAFFAIFNLFWTTLFLEAWKRKCNAKAFHWGTYGEISNPQIGNVIFNCSCTCSETIFFNFERSQVWYSVVPLKY